MSYWFCLIILSFLRSVDNNATLRSQENCENDKCFTDDIFVSSNTKTPLSDVAVEVLTSPNVENKELNYKNAEYETIFNTSDFFKNDQEEIRISQNLTNSINDTQVSETDIKLTSEGTESLSTVGTTTESIKSTTKIETSTTKAPSLEIFKFSNLTNDDICICDLMQNQCDINCCCDKECTSSHFQVFTKCNDANVQIDGKYCLSSKLLFINNTAHKIVENSKRLFCIVKDNSQCHSGYKPKEAIKSLEIFNKSLPQNYYSYFFKSQIKPNFFIKDYLPGLPVWSVLNEVMKPFSIPTSSVGLLCSSQLNIKYLVDQATKCWHPPLTDCGENSGIRNILIFLKNLKIISNPGAFNKSLKLEPEKVCKSISCIDVTSYICESFSNSQCTKAQEKFGMLSHLGCENVISKSEYRIWHNGTEGIKKFEVYFWLKKIPKDNIEPPIQTTEVKYFWVGTPDKVFVRSGNPGYLTGKPILAGRKVSLVANGTADKKEAIELSYDSNDWLSALGSEKGVCSSEKRIPIKFRENSQFMCSLELVRSNFTKDKCKELQQNIFRLLIGSDVINSIADNYYNKFVGTFGNSKVEETGDWAQVLIDLYPITSSQVGFKFNYNSLICKNIITDLYVEIAYANIGSFLNPQSKILGVHFRFGEYKDLIFYCDTPECRNSSHVRRHFKLFSGVHFFDVTEPAVDAFAEPLGLETKLPHDFFYPFFSKSCVFQSVRVHVFVLVFVAFLSE